MRKQYGLFWLVLVALLFPTVVAAQGQTRWQPTLESAKRLAGQTDRLVLIYFWADWCSVCQKMEADVLDQAGVDAALQPDYVLVKINADHFPATARQFGVTALPTTVIVNAQGQPLDKMQGRLEAAEFVGRLRQTAGLAKRPGSQAYAQIPSGAPQSAPTTTDPRRDSPAPQSPATAGYTADRYRDDNSPRYSDRIQQAEVASVGPRYDGPGSPPLQVPSQDMPGASIRSVQPQTPPLEPNATQPPVFGPNTAQPPSMAQPPVFGPNIAQPPVGPPVGPMIPGAAIQPAPGAIPEAQPAAGNPPLGLEGYCPVTLVDNKTSWELGDRRWGAIHRGRTYLFASAEQQRRFLADPDRYAPVMSGNDVVLALDRGQTVEGRREHGVFFGDRIYLFATEETLDAFGKNPNLYVDRVTQMMQAQTLPANSRR